MDFFAAVSAFHPSFLVNSLKTGTDSIFLVAAAAVESRTCDQRELASRVRMTGVASIKGNYDEKLVS